MKREFLEGLGLDKETIDKIMSEHGKTIETHKTKATNLQTSLDELKEQLAQRDKDLKDLKKKAEGSEDLQKQLTSLQEKYNTEKEAYEAKLKETQLATALKLALNGKVHDTDLVIGLINREKIKLGEDGNVTDGLEEQIKELQKSKSFLFIPEGDLAPAVKGAKPVEGDPGGGQQTTSVGSRFAKTMNKQEEPIKNSIWD